MNRLGKNEVHKLLSSDKNYRLAFIETQCLTKRNISDHLSNEMVYKRLSKGEACGQLDGVERLIDHLSATIKMNF